jgi:hypothetical protein
MAHSSHRHVDFSMRWKRRSTAPYGRRRGMLTPGRYSLTWSQGDEPWGSISLVTQVDGVRLLYWVTTASGARTCVNELVPFRSTATRFGGHRKWLTCLTCQRRCRRLFGGRSFRCRHCHGLKYTSQREYPAQRAMQRADRIANRLHDMWRGTTKSAWEFPPKPRRMRWRTYQRLERQYAELQRRWMMGMRQFIGRFRQR